MRKRESFPKGRGGTPSGPSSDQTISAVDDALSTTRLTVPKRVLS